MATPSVSSNVNLANIKSRLATASWSTRDNVAQEIINSSSPQQIRSLPAEAVLRLVRELMNGFVSEGDRKAVKKLRKDSQFQVLGNSLPTVITTLKNSPKIQPTAKALLTEQLVLRIYAAEKKRLSWYEKAGIDGSTMGRGQLGDPAYMDVKRDLRSVLEAFATRVFAAKVLYNPLQQDFNVLLHDHFDKGLRVKIPTAYAAAMKNRDIENFVVAAFLTLKLNASSKRSGRSSCDVLKFAVAVYHGMFKSVSNAQTAVKDDVNWIPVEAELRKSGDPIVIDKLDYVDEVAQCNSP